MTAMRVDKTMTLEEMLPPECLKEVLALAQAGKREARDFKPTLAKYTAELEARGVLPDYAAYAIQYVLIMARSS